MIPPWKSHLDPKIPLPDKIEDSPVSKPKKPKRQWDKKPVRRYAGLPAPLTTRSKAKQTEISISSLDYCALLRQQLPSDQPDFDVDIYDQFFERRYYTFNSAIFSLLGTYYFIEVTCSGGRTRPLNVLHSK